MMLLTTLFTTLLAVTSVSASCARGIPHLDPFVRSADGTVAVPPFNYGITTGPLNWHNLNTTYFLCGNGTNQSPILFNSSSTTIVPKGTVNLSIPTAHNIVFENLGVNVEVVINGTLKIANTTWALTQFHFHTPSEHRVDFAHYDAEWHFVFSATDGSKAISVLGFFITVDPNGTDSFLETLFSHLPAIQTPGTTTTVPTVDLSSFEQTANNAKYYSYTGSLTTPPCTEGVNWYVATTPISLSTKTYLALKATTKTNNRYSSNSSGQPNVLVVASSGL